MTIDDQSIINLVTYCLSVSQLWCDSLSVHCALTTDDFLQIVHYVSEDLSAMNLDVQRAKW